MREYILSITSCRHWCGIFVEQLRGDSRGLLGHFIPVMASHINRDWFGQYLPARRIGWAYFLDWIRSHLPVG